MAEPATMALPTKPGGLDGRTVLPEDFDELSLFGLLKARFGAPNGFLTFLGPPGGHPDGPYKWDYLFRPRQDMHLQIVRSVNGIEAQWWGFNGPATQVLEYLENNIARNQKRISEAIRSLDHFRLVINPYKRHRVLLQAAVRDLARIEPMRPTMPTVVPVDRKTTERYLEDFKVYMGEVELQASRNTIVVLEAAFLSESFMNLILALLVRPDIRQSKSVWDETIRRNWRQKLERLTIDCRFVTKADLGDSRVRDAKEMFQLRNRIAHSWPDPNALEVGEVWFEQSFPVLLKAQPFSEFSIALHNQLPSKTDALRAAQHSENFVTFLAELIEPSIRSEFLFAAEANPLGFNDKTGSYAVPFGPDQAVMVALGN